MKPYCTQNNGECETCSLGSYRRDCQNNPVKRPQLYHVWGRGPAQSNLIRDAEASEAAARTALHHGFDPGADSDCWAVEVRASEAEIDAATRHDAAVTAYVEGESEQLSLSAVAGLLGITRQALSNRISRGTFPPADGHIREPGGDRPYWLRPTVLRYQIEREVGPIAGLSDQGGLDNLRETYNLATDHPLGAQLAGQGLLTDEQGRLLDDLLPVFDLRGRIIDYEAAVNLMDDELREELHVELPPCSRQKFLVEYAVRHYKRFGESFAPWIGGAW